MDNHNENSCCSNAAAKHMPDEHAAHGHGFDALYSSSVLIILGAIIANMLLPYLGISSPIYLHHFTHAILDILATMWWGIALGIIIVGIMSTMPRMLFTAMMGRGDGFSGLVRAVIGGLFLDLCCHGILLVASKLYERGVSLAQVITFMVASPWNSLSLTLILITLIGFQWTMLYIFGSVIIALITGLIIQKLTLSGTLPANPNKCERPEDLSFKSEFKSYLSSLRPSIKGTGDILRSGWTDGKMIIKWLLFGTLLAASIRTFIPPEVFSTWFGPTIVGLLLTVLVATIIEICSEGSAPVAGELFSIAGAPGNGFAFLMAGVATDYTEILIIREFTKSWKVALALPIITVPQVLFIGWLMNIAAQ